MKTMFGSITMHAVGGPTNRTVRLRKIEQISGGRFNPIAVRAAAQIHRFAISRATMARFRAENGEAMSDFERYIVTASIRKF